MNASKKVQAEEIFCEDLSGRAEIDVIQCAFKDAGLLDKYSDTEKIDRFDKESTRALIRRIDIILSKEGEDAVRIRGVINVSTYDEEKDKTIFNYVYILKATGEELMKTAAKYKKIGNIYIQKGDELMNIVTGQMYWDFG